MENVRVEARGLTFDLTMGGPATGDPVLLLHGFPQHSGQWDRVLPFLHAAGLRTYALNQRGYSPGARPSAVDDYRQAELVADVVTVLDALGVDSAHLVGHDWGAAIAWQVAAAHPTRARTLSAVSAPHPAALAHALTHDAEQRTRSGYMTVFQRTGEAERLLLAADAERFRAMLLPIDADRVRGYLEPMLAPGALTAALNWYRATSAHDLAGVGPVAVPTTFVWSDGDVAFTRSVAEACAGHVTGDYRPVTLAGVSHWIPDEAPEALATAVLARIRS